jgi:hypothetical protein
MKKKENKILAISSFVIVFNVFAFAFIGFALLNNNVETITKDSGISAMVDPAIYKPGDTSLTIYGACLDSSSHPTDTNATITIYNSTQDKWAYANMSSISTGRFNYSTNAPSATGNYFVEINCSTGSTSALAHSNFQVAGWAGGGCFRTICSGHNANCTPPACPSGYTNVSAAQCYKVGGIWSTQNTSWSVDTRGQGYSAEYSPLNLGHGYAYGQIADYYETCERWCCKD